MITQHSEHFKLKNLVRSEIYFTMSKRIDHGNERNKKIKNTHTWNGEIDQHVKWWNWPTAFMISFQKIRARQSQNDLLWKLQQIKETEPTILFLFSWLIFLSLSRKLCPDFLCHKFVSKLDVSSINQVIKYGFI